MTHLDQSQAEFGRRKYPDVRRRRRQLTALVTTAALVINNDNPRIFTQAPAPQLILMNSPAKSTSKQQDMHEANMRGYYN